MSNAPTYSDGSSAKASRTWRRMFGGRFPAAGKWAGVMSRPTYWCSGCWRARSRSQALLYHEQSLADFDKNVDARITARNIRDLEGFAPDGNLGMQQVAELMREDPVLEVESAVYVSSQRTRPHSCYTRGHAWLTSGNLAPSNKR